MTSCEWCHVDVNSRGASGGALCTTCLTTSIRVTCQQCRSEWRGKPGHASVRPCGSCATDLKQYGPHASRPCIYCHLPAAFPPARIMCRRCTEYHRQLGEPAPCDQCGIQSAFTRTKEQLRRTGDRLLCFLCTREYKRSHKRMRMSPPPASSAESDGRALSLSPPLPSQPLMTLIRLPPVLLRLCFANLALDELLLSLPHVCHEFRYLILPPSNLLRAIRFTSLHLPASITQAVLQESLSRFSAQSIHTLTLVDCSKLLLNFLDAFPSLTYLDCSGCRFGAKSFQSATFNYLSTLIMPCRQKQQLQYLPHCPELKVLDVSCRQWIVGPADPLHLITESRPSRIEVADLSVTNLDTGHLFLFSADTLRYLDVSRCTIVDAPNMIRTIADRFVLLQYLSVGGAGKAFGSALCRHVLQTLPLLRSLDVSETSVTNDAFNVDHPNLTSLYLRGCVNMLKRPHLSLAMRHFPSLQVLDLSSCLDLDDKSILSLSTLVPNRLMSLNLGHLVKLSYRSIIGLAPIASLREIRFGGSWYIALTRAIEDRIRQTNALLTLFSRDSLDNDSALKRYTSFLQ